MIMLSHLLSRVLDIFIFMITKECNAYEIVL